MGAIFLITGEPGIGKSTVVSKVMLRLMSRGVIVGGCITSEKRSRGVRLGFSVKDLTNGTEGEMASVQGSLGPKVGKYRVNLSNLASIGAKGLLDAARRSELIVIDEVGPMELTSPEFRRAVGACVDSGKPILAVVHERMEDDLLSSLRAAAASTTVVDDRNRDDLPAEIADRLLEALGSPKPS